MDEVPWLVGLGTRRAVDQKHRPPGKSNMVATFRESGKGAKNKWFFCISDNHIRQLFRYSSLSWLMMSRSGRAGSEVAGNQISGPNDTGRWSWKLKIDVFVGGLVLIWL